MDWRQFTMNLESLEADQVEQVFARHGALAVTLSDAGDNPILEPGVGETPLWTDTCITALFNADADMLSLREDLLESLELDDLPSNHVESIEQRAWEREWLRDFRPMQFGERLWVSPRDMEVNAPQAIIVRLDPGLAFGTGTHETTALCLKWLEQLDVQGKRVLDVGCGSGILSIAALMLGAKSAYGVDIDPQAIIASRQNADENGVGAQLELATEMPQAGEEYDIVIANILAGTLIELAQDISKRTVHGGDLALSGILNNQIGDVTAAYANWITLDPTAVDNGWARISGVRN